MFPVGKVEQDAAGDPAQDPAARRKRQADQGSLACRLQVGGVAEDALEAVRRLEALPHVTVVVATGRSTVATLPVLEQFGLMTPGRPVVCSNGAVIYDIGADRVVSAELLTQRPTLAVVGPFDEGRDFSASVA